MNAVPDESDLFNEVDQGAVGNYELTINADCD